MTATKAPPARRRPAAKSPKPAASATSIKAAETQMTDDLKEFVTELRTEVAGINDYNIDHRVKLGKRLVEVYDDDTGKYGTNPEELVLKAMPLSRDGIRPMVQLVRTFSDADIERLRKIKNPKTGEHLNWTQFIALTRVADKDQAFSLAEKAINNEWTAKDLNRAVVKAQGGKKSKGGRKPRRLTTVAACLDDIDAKVQAMTNVVEKSWMEAKEGLQALFDSAARAGNVADPVLVARLEASRDGVYSLCHTLRSVELTLSHIHTQANAALKLTTNGHAAP